MKLTQEQRHTSLRTGLIFFFFLTSALIGTASAQDAPSAQVTEVEQLTNALVASAQGGNAPAGANLVSAAQKRRALLLKLFATSPRDAQRFMLPDDVAAKLPASLDGLVETDADEQGTLEVRVEDYPDSTHRMLFFLSTARERLQLHFAKNEPRHLLSGTRVRARGKRLNGALLLQSGSANTGSSSDLQVMALASPNTFGAQSTVVLLVNFQDNAAQPSTVDAMRNLVFTTLSNFDQENSQNQTWLTGDVFGWYTLAMSSSSCDTNMIASLAKTAASNAGVNLSGYRRFVYAFPNTSACGGWAGLGTIAAIPASPGSTAT